jgi:hypothetical protein
MLWGSAFTAALLTAATVLGLMGCSFPTDEKDSYTVKFEVYGGMPVPPSQSVSSGGRAKLPDPVPTKFGEEPVGWYRESGYQTPWLFSTDSVTADITLHAKWPVPPVQSNENKAALVEAGQIVITAKDKSDAEVSLVLEVKSNDTVSLTIGGGSPKSYPSIITDSAIILVEAGSGGVDVALGYVINDGKLTITGGLDKIADAGLAAGEVVSEENSNLTKPVFEAVTNIANVPSTGTTGTQVDLSGATVVPSGATKKAITWTVKSAGGTGVATAGIVNGKFTPATAGDLVLTATVVDGKNEGTEDYTQDFTIKISPAFKAVTNITGVPTGGKVGSEVDLTKATAEPAGATNRTPITWTVKAADTTGVTNAAVAGGKFTPNAAGTLELTASIANGTAEGTAFTRDFEIIISPANSFVPVTNITNVPDSGEVGSEADLTVATVVPNTANNKTIVWTVKEPGATGLTTANIVNGKFTATTPGTVKLTATIANGTAEGTNYTKDFDILISMPGSFVAVTNITGVPDEGTVGSLVSLAGATVVPNTATYKTIAWRVTSAGVGLSLGALDGNSFTPTLAGTVGLTAFILSGAGNMAPYSQEFEITVNPAFVAVSGINGLPATWNAVTGEPINLNAGITVMPTEATNKTIVWSVKTPGDTGLTSDNVASGSFTPSKDGIATLTATILNGLAQGSNYTQGITITIIEPVTGISNIPTNGTKGYAVDLTGALAAPGTATNKTIVWTVATNDNGSVGITNSDLTTGIFTPAKTGTLRLTATIVDGTAVGTNYTRAATITINDPGETTPGIGLGEDTSIILKDKNGAPLSKDGVNEIALNDAAYFVYISGYTDIVWRINGTVQDVTTELIYPPVTTARKITIAAMGRKNGKLESTGTYTFEIK